MDSDRLLLWIVFNVFVLGMLALDLGVFHRKAHAVSLREALTWSVVWISLALVFNAWIYYLWGPEKALEFLTGYLIEKSLSVDNIFVFLVIFSYFSVPAMYQHRVLFWGILGALIMRAIFIATGAALLTKFHWMIYVFGGFLVFTGLKLLFAGDEKLEPEKNPAVRLARRYLNITKEYCGQNFFVRQNEKLWATPLLLVLLVVETTDVIFAVDSIPAIFAITLDPFIVYTSNVFAILGLRALYFLLAGVMDMFRFLKIGLSFVLCFVGVKMTLVDIFKIPIGISLGTVAMILLVSVIASLLVRPKEAAKASLEPDSGSPSTSRVRNTPGSLAGRSKKSTVKTFVWIAIIVAAILAALTLVKTTTITRAPSTVDAIVAIRLADREMLEINKAQPNGTVPPLIQAEEALKAAWASFHDGLTQEATAAATKAREAARKVG